MNRATESLLVLIPVILCLGSHGAAQVSGSLSGTVLDTQGLIAPGVSVKLVSDSTGISREVISESNGTFTFTAFPPGMYSLFIEFPGFKRYERRAIELTASDNFSVGQIRLELAGLNETVTVTTQGTPMQRASGERSGIISSEQIEILTVLNRDFAVLVALQPGVVDEPGAEAPGFAGSARFNVLGGRQGANNVTIDGVPSDNSNGTGTNTFISVDAVESVRILVSNFQAEFGRKPGASIQAVTKSGSREYTGSAYFYKRHESWSADDFFNNRQGIIEPPYRYSTLGLTIGGPLHIPKLLGPKRDKLFFFFSSERWSERRPQAIRQVIVPTELERKGDFSQSLDTNNRLIAVNDPLDGKKQFPGNVIPQSRINVNTQRYLKLFPLPNFVDRDGSRGTYNYQTQESLDIPKHTETVRIDYHINQKNQVYGRFLNWWEGVRGWAVPAGNANWGWLPNDYNDISRTATLSATHIFSRSTILEGSMGIMHWTEKSLPGLTPEYLQRVTRPGAGINIPQFHQENNPLNPLPQATFSGVTGAASTSYENRFPINGVETVLTWNVGFTRVRGRHTSKLGFFAERWFQDKGPSGNFAGRIAFDRNTNDPNDANHPYAHALLGNFSNYTESTTRPALLGRVTVCEWFAQDNWKASRRLTLDLGIRFGWSQPFHDPDRAEAGFLPGRYDFAKAVKLIQPAMAGGRRVGINPLTGEVLPVETIGAITPGSGDKFNGSVDARVDRGYPAGLRYNSGIKVAPRVGFAWDPRGKARTVIRGGIGLFYQMRDRDNLYTNIFANPPFRLDPTIYYGNVETLTSQSGFVFPSATNGYDPNRSLERVTNYSLGMQRDIGFKTVVDISYAGALGRHLINRRNLNAIPAGTTFLASSRDPTTGRALPNNFLRPYPGYDTINYSEYGSNSSYHSMQVKVDRRAARGINLGAAWTWSKDMDYVDNEIVSISNLVDRKIWNYGEAGFDRTHIFKANWMWNLPRAGRLRRNAFTHTVLDNWAVSGINTFMSGAPMAIGTPSFSCTTDITGSPTDGPRVVVADKPTLPKSHRTFSQNFNTDAFRAPVVGTFGNAPKDVFRGPGINNWDISFFKNVPLHTERVRLQFRGKLYNAFNHTQFSGVYTTIRFDRDGNQIDTRLGEFTSARNPRRIQLALRLTF